MARVEIKREKGSKDSIREYQIELDDEVVGSVKAGESSSFDVQPGPHRLRLKIDWCSSGYLDFTIDNNEQTLSFECGNNVPALSDLIYVIFLRDEYLWLKRT